MTTTTIELIDWVERQSKLAIKEACPNAATGLDAVAQRLRELDKPDCVYTLCADDSPTPNTLESGCEGAVLWYLGDDGKGAYPNFCHYCSGAVRGAA